MQHILDVQFPDQNPRGAPSGDLQQIATNPGMFGGLRAEGERAYGQGLQALGQGEERYGSGQTSLGEGIANYGRSVSGLGGDITRAAVTGLQFATEQQTLQNRIHAADVKSWYADQTTDLHTKFMSLSGRAALDALPSYKEQLGKLKEDALDKINAPQEKVLLNDSLTSIQDQYYRYWSGHAGGQLKTYQDKVAQDSIASSSAMAVSSLLSGDEVGFERRLREQDVEVHNFYDGQGYGPDDMKAEVAKRRGATLRTAIETVAAGGDVGKAQALLNKYRDRMDPQSVLAVTANLRSGVAQVQGRGVADEASGHVLPKADSVADVPASFIAQIKRTEGFSPTAKWDAKQFSNGYGTRAQAGGETITREEAEKRFGAAITSAAGIVDKVNPKLDPGTRAALTSLTYETGDAWTRSGLGDAIRAGDLAKARQIFVQYNKVEGATNDAVADRRFRESQWFGANDAPPVNGPLVDKQQAYERVLADTDGNPLVQTAAVARLNQLYGIYHAEQVSRNASFDLRLKDSRTEAIATGSAKNPLNEADFVNRYGAAEGQRQYGEYQKDLALGADMAGLSQMSEDEQNQVLARHAPVAGSEGYAADVARLGHLQEAVARVRSERDQDPAAFAVTRLDAAKTAAAGLQSVMANKDATPEMQRIAANHYAHIILSEEARVGVPAAKQSILSAQQLARIGGELSAALGSDDPKARQAVVPLIKSQAALWGDFWPQVAGQVLPNASPVAKIVAAGDDATGAAMLRVLSLAKDDNPAKLLKEQNETSAHNMTAALNTALAPFRRTMVGQQAERDFKGYYDTAEKLAALYVRDGKGAEEAAQSAADDVVNRRYVFADTYRIPRSPALDADAVQRGAEYARNLIVQGNGTDSANPFNEVRLQVNDLGVSDNEADSRANYAREGRYVTSPDSAGLNIAYKNTFVANKAGQPILLTWRQLEALGRTAEAARVPPVPGPSL